MAVSRLNIELPERYRPLRHIANGGMAAVWAAEDGLLGREVAIKVLAPHLAENDRARRRFQREARTAAGLSGHPHAITIYDVGEHEGRPFIVMESLPGGSLADRLRARPRVAREGALRWLRDAASALDAAHGREIVHRDVKPGNMLFDSHDRLVLADFGIARLAYDPTVTTTGDVLGTAAYVSPEQADGRPATPASDRYSLAVVAYELLTGTRPFRAEHFAATARQHIEAAPDPPSLREPSLSPEVDAVLLRGLAKDPAQRWAAATELVASLEDALFPPAVVEDHDQTVPLPPPVPAAPPGPAAPPVPADQAPQAPPPARLVPRRTTSPAASPKPRGTSPAASREPQPGTSPAASPEPRRATSPAPPPGPRRAAPSAPITRPTVHRARRRPGWLLPAGLVGVLALVALAVALAGGGGERADRSDSSAREARSSNGGESSSGSSQRSEADAGQPATPSTPPSAGGAETPRGGEGSASSGGATSGTSAAALNDQGFGLLNARRYDEAIPVLQRAYEACGRRVENLTCAYAAFNLGRALRLGGRADEAIPILERRLAYPDQRDTVKAELDAARSAAEG